MIKVVCTCWLHTVKKANGNQRCNRNFPLPLLENPIRGSEQKQSPSTVEGGRGKSRRCTYVWLERTALVLTCSRGWARQPLVLTWSSVWAGEQVVLTSSWGRARQPVFPTWSWGWARQSRILTCCLGWARQPPTGSEVGLMRSQLRRRWKTNRRGVTSIL